MTTRRLMLTICLAIIVAGCVLPVPVPFNSEKDLEDTFAYSKQQQDQAKTDYDKKECMEWATKATDHDPRIVKKWPDTWKEWAWKNLGQETAQQRWRRAYFVCMEARGYIVK